MVDPKNAVKLWGEQEEEFFGCKRRGNMSENIAWSIEEGTFSRC